MTTLTSTWRYLAAILCLLAVAAFAQEGDEPAEEAASEPAAEASADTESEEELIDDPELDAQGFDPTSDDDFVPSEDIPADAPIAFPTDI